MSTLTSSSPRRRARLGIALAIALFAALALVVGALAVVMHGLYALKAAGLVGTAPTQGAGVFAQLLGTLESNEKWLMFTGFGLAGTTVALLFFMGSMRAPDILFKLLMGVAMVLIVIPAFLA